QQRHQRAGGVAHGAGAVRDRSRLRLRRRHRDLLRLLPGAQSLAARSDRSASLRVAPRPAPRSRAPPLRPRRLTITERAAATPGSLASAEIVQVILEGGRLLSLSAMPRRRNVAPRPARRTRRPSPTASEAERRLLALARELGGLGRDALPRALRALAAASPPEALALGRPSAIAERLKALTVLTGREVAP